MPRAGDVGRKVAKSIPEEWKELVGQLKRFCGHIGSERKQTQREIVDRLAESRGCLTEHTRFSKVLNGHIFPDYALVAALHGLACEDAGPNVVGTTAEDLESLYWRAKDARCRSCAGHVRRVRELEEQAKSCREFHVDVRFAQSASGVSTHLPVSLLEGDRQVREFPAVADELTERAARALAEGRSEDALALIGEVVERLDAQEVAACVAALRGRAEHGLADTLLQLYGREQAARQVMRLALRLQEAGHVADAGVAMRASIG